MVGVVALAAQQGGKRRLVRESGARAVSMLAGPKVLEGTGGPFPDDFWDPAGLAKGKSDQQLIRWREIELKHGRVSMLAVLGWFHNSAGWHPVGDAANRMRVSDDPLTAAAQLPMGGAWQVVFTIMCLEWLITYVIKPPADKPWDIIGFDELDVEDQGANYKERQIQEINNGRLAMMAIVGLISQDVVTGDYFDFFQTALQPQNWVGRLIPDVPYEGVAKIGVNPLFKPPPYLDLNVGDHWVPL